MLIALNACGSDCGSPDKWGPSTVLYNGPFDPQSNGSAPEKGHFQDFRFQLPAVTPGQAVIQVSHLFKVGGVSLTPRSHEATPLTSTGTGNPPGRL